MIEIQNVYKAFGEKQVLDGVSLTISKGESHIIIGKSGCGKSVLLKLMVGLLQADQGDIRIDGRSTQEVHRRDLYEIRRKVGMLFQNSALFDSMTVAENISLGVREHRMFAEAEIRRRVEEKLEMVNLPGIGDMSPAALSGGMRKRVALARALMMDPAYVLYDEPTTGLDPVMADVINHLILRIKKNLGVTSVVVTHDMASAYTVGDKMSMLHEGKIRFSGTPDQIRRDQDPFIQEFITGNSMERAV